MRSWVGIVLVTFGASACGLISGGAPTDNDPPPEGQPPTPGDECSDPGETVPAGDGCNTCNCHDGYWQCTLIGCTATPGEGCSQEGDKAPADDHCNTCTC